MIEYKDFVPRMLGPAGFLGEPEFESLEDAMEACNKWIESNGVEVINVETVVLPNLHNPLEGGSGDVNIRQNEDHVTAWNQYIRVWIKR